jgi:hypothetical protein
VSDYTPTTEEVRNKFWLGEYDLSKTDWISSEANFNRWLAEHDREIVARTLAAQSTGGVCQVNDPDLEWRGWVEEATLLIKGEEQ